MNSMRNGAKLFAIGTGASVTGTVITNSLIRLRKAIDKSFAREAEDIPILATGAAYGVYMSLSSNLRYQTLAGIIEQRLLEPLLHNHKILLSALCFAFRTGNTFLGSLIFHPTSLIINLLPNYSHFQHSSTNTFNDNKISKKKDEEPATIHYCYWSFGAMLLRTWGSRRQKRGEGDLTVGIPSLQIYRSSRDESTRPNLDQTSRRNSAHAPVRGVGDLELRQRVKTLVAAPLPPAASPPYSDHSPLPTQPRSDTMESKGCFGRDHLKYLVMEAIRCGCQGHRAEMNAARVAKCLAALEGRDKANADDLKKVVSYLPMSFENRVAAVDIATQFQECKFLKWWIKKLILLKHRKAEKFYFAAINNKNHFKSDSSVQGPVKRLAVDATLRAAAPYQKLRREKGIQKSRKIFVEKTDIESQKNGTQSGSLGRSHYSLSAQPASVLIPLVSSFLLTIYINPISYNRVAYKFLGFALFLFVEMLQKFCCLLQGQSQWQESISVLRDFPVGGGSPLAHGLTTAVRVGMNAEKSGDVGRIMIIAIIDGRANISLKRSTDPEAAASSDAPRPSTQN
nr:protein RETICULATA-RELATED 4, chloroplastic-like [Ipomoea batatas]